MNIAPKLIATLLSLLITVGSLSGSVAQPSPSLMQKAYDAGAMAQSVEQTGSIRVIIEFAPLLPERDMKPDPATIGRVKEYVLARQNGILAQHFGDPSRPSPAPGFERAIKRGTISPFFAINVTKSELEALAADPEILGLNYDRSYATALKSSVPSIGMTTPNGGAYAKGATGAGQAIAIVDTGVQVSHPFITASKVIAEACFSTTSSIDSTTSLCRNGLEFDSGPGAAADCTGFPDCSHGTLVAGIAAGNNTSPTSPAGGPPNGVAKDARLIAVKVFSRSGDIQTCNGFGNTPCIITKISDVVSALDWLYENAQLFNAKLAAVNLSLGGRQLFSNYCDADQDVRLFKASVGRLRTMNVATIQAVGNESSVNSINKPSCVSNVVRVASSNKVDGVSPFSNMARIVDVLAPGGAHLGQHLPEDILSSVPSNRYLSDGGTSLAVPHVVGAFAALRSVYPSATVEQILNALTSTGLRITDTRSQDQITKPRIQVDRALAALGPPMIIVHPDASAHTSGDAGGGTFFPEAFEYELSSTGPVDFEISIGPSPPWLSVSPSSGKVDTSSPVKITFKVQAGGFPPSKRTATITFSNKTNGLGNTTRSASVTIFDPNENAFHGLSPLPGFRTGYSSAISSDGLAIAGESCSIALVNCQAMQWYKGFRFSAGTLPTYPISRGLAVASNGANLVGTLARYSLTAGNNQSASVGAGSTQAFLATFQGPAGLGFLLGHDKSEATAISANGGVIVGRSENASVLGSNRAVQWIRGSIKQLPTLQGEVGDTYAYGVNRDGSVIVGSDFGQAVLWSGNGEQIKALRFLQPDHRFSRAQGVSADGSVVVGFSRTDNNFGTDMAFRWAGTAMSALGTLAGASDSIAYAANGDGSVIVGSSGGRAFRWTAAGMKSIQELATTAGFDLSRWQLSTATGISENGSIIVGSGLYDETGTGQILIQSAWLLRLKP